jgi:hypothetical protein
MRHVSGSLALVAGAALLSGCATTHQPSYVIGERWFKASMDTEPVIILGIDNWDTLQRRTLVDPGPHVIRVQAMPVPGAPHEVGQLTLDVKPCVTYYIVAVRPNRLTAEFTPRVDYAQPLGGCDPTRDKG